MTKRKNKDPVATLSGEDSWNKIFDMQGESLARAMDKQRAEADQREKDIEESSELFHKLWGEAHDSPNYNKNNWNKLQTLLRKLGIKA
jgi:hypothetical protein